MRYEITGNKGQTIWMLTLTEFDCGGDSRPVITWSDPEAPTWLPDWKEGGFSFPLTRDDILDMWDQLLESEDSQACLELYDFVFAMDPAIELGKELDRCD